MRKKDRGGRGFSFVSFRLYKDNGRVQSHPVPPHSPPFSDVRRVRRGCVDVSVIPFASMGPDGETLNCERVRVWTSRGLNFYWNRLSEYIRDRSRLLSQFLLGESSDLSPTFTPSRPFLPPSYLRT